MVILAATPGRLHWPRLGFAMDAIRFDPNNPEAMIESLAEPGYERIDQEPKARPRRLR